MCCIYYIRKTYCVAFGEQPCVDYPDIILIETPGPCCCRTAPTGCNKSVPGVTFCISEPGNIQLGPWSTLGDCCAALSTNCTPHGCCCGSSCRNVWIGVSCENGCQNFGFDCSIPGSCTDRSTICTGPEPRSCGNGCCLCDHCCDMPSAQCSSLGGLPLGQSCTDPTMQANCRNQIVRKPCVEGLWHAFKTAAGNRWEIGSVLAENPTDRPASEVECRMVIAKIQKAAPAKRWEALICNQYNRRCSGTKAVQPLRMNKNGAGNRWHWAGRYRPPCPESLASPCVGGNVGCI